MGATCKSCGSTNEARTKFCSSCGAQLGSPKKLKVLIAAGVGLLLAGGGGFIYVLNTDVHYSAAYKSIATACSVIKEMQVPISTPDDANSYSTRISSPLVEAFKLDKARATKFQAIPSELSSYADKVQSYAEAEAMARIQADPWGFLLSGPILQQTVVLPESISSESTKIKTDALKLCAPYLTK